MPKQYGSAGPRLIYPESCDSASLASCEPLAQLLFDRLLVQSDDQGRMPGDALQIKARCMPRIVEATPRRIEKWLGQLVAHGLVRLYGDIDYRLIQIEAWWKHQGSMRRAYPSRWPAPAGWEDRVYGLPKTPDIAADEQQSAGNVRAKRPANTAPASASASAITNASASADASAADDVDAADTYWSLTGRYPTDKLLRWIDEAAERFGHDSLSKWLAAEHRADGSPATLMGRAVDRCRAQERELDRKEREDEKRRLAEKRSRPRVVEQWREEYRRAIEERYGRDAA